jgi:hypothetical protein
VRSGVREDSSWARALALALAWTATLAPCLTLPVNAQAQYTPPYTAPTAPGVAAAGSSAPASGSGLFSAPQIASMAPAAPALSAAPSASFAAAGLSGATPGTIGQPPSSPVAGFAGLHSRSGINPADLPTSPNDPRMMKMNGMVPKFTPNFFQSMQQSMLGQGTVLTGILEQDVSSDKSKPGDVFSIRLEDGYSNNGVEIIPKQSKILGSVSSVLSSHSRNGAHPGTVTISLQTLIFPDGRTTQFWGFIEHNPLADNLSKNGSGMAQKAGGYGSMAAFGAARFFTKRVGYNLQKPNFGKEMKLEKGEVLPVKTNRMMDLSKMNAPIQQTAMPPGSVNGVYQSGGMPPGMNAVPPTATNAVPGLPPYTPVPANYAPPVGSVPGLSAPASSSFGGALPAYTPVAGSGQPPMAPYPSQMEPF